MLRMGRIGRTAAIAVGVAVLGFCGVGAGRAADGQAGMDHAAHGAALPAGVQIREVKVEGYSLAYRLYSWDERNVMMKGMEGHAMAGMDGSGRSTHHLMLFVKGPDGKEVGGAKVGFIVTGPDKTEFKTLTMAMFGGYGADVPLKAPGVHTVRTKAVIGERTVADEFAHTIK